MGLRKLLGGAPEEPKIIESTTQASQMQKPSSDSTNTKQQAPLQSHNPFSIVIDPMSNVPERPFIPPLERVNDKVVNLDAKEVSDVSENAAVCSKMNEEIKTDPGEKDIEINKMDKEVTENIKFVSTSTEDKRVELKADDNKPKVEDVSLIIAKSDIQTPEAEKPKNTVLTFEAMTPIRQVISKKFPSLIDILIGMKI